MVQQFGSGSAGGPYVVAVLCLQSFSDNQVAAALVVVDS